MEPNIRSILENSTTIAVYGMSRDAWKPAHTVPGYMLNQGYIVIPVNPYADRIFGRKSYPDLKSVPDHIDLLNVFRPSGKVLPVVEEAVERRRERGDIHAIWLQLGIVNEEARALAQDAGILFVQNRCIYVDHKVSGIPRKRRESDDADTTREL